jgi:hypothetical protein
MSKTCGVKSAGLESQGQFELPAIGEGGPPVGAGSGPADI